MKIFMFKFNFFINFFLSLLQVRSIKPNLIPHEDYQVIECHYQDHYYHF